MDYPKIYLDSDDVERGYYVYAHICKHTGTVFYIGKGHGKRAWSDRRSRAWREHVAGLPDGYEVRLIHGDLTEEESIHLERKEIQANGGPASQGGTLINWIPGEAGFGFGVAATISVGCGALAPEEREQAEESQAAYAAARRYRSLTKRQKDSLENQFLEIVSPTVEPIEEAHERWMAGGMDGPFSSLLDSYRTYCYEIHSLCWRIRGRKLSFVDFCCELESYIDSLESALDEARGQPAAADNLRLCERAYNAVIEWSQAVAEGSREDASRARERLHLDRTFPPDEDHEERFAQHVALLRSFFGEKRASMTVAVREAQLAEHRQRMRE